VAANVHCCCCCRSRTLDLCDRCRIAADCFVSRGYTNTHSVPIRCSPRNCRVATLKDDPARFDYGRHRNSLWVDFEMHLMIVSSIRPEPRRIRANYSSQFNSGSLPVAYDMRRPW
jgi:hypothetical protein